MTDIAGSRTLQSQWNDTVRFYPDHTFLEYVSVQEQTTCFTYAEFDLLVHKTANFLLDLGVKAGELVALHLHNRPEYLMCWLALAQIGAVSVPLNEHYRLSESEYALQKCEVKRIIAEPESLSLYTQFQERIGLEQIILAGDSVENSKVISLTEGMCKQPYDLKENRRVKPEDTAVILFTSGTTRHPKGVIYTHCNVVYGGLLHLSQMGMSENDRFLSAMPCYHMDFQEMAAMPVICTGSTLIMVEHYSARRFWRQVCQHEASFTDTMSVMNRTMLLQPVQPWEKNHKLKQIYFSMGLSVEEKKQFEDRFRVRLLNSYGMTETISAVTCAPLFGDKNWPSVGRPALSYEIKIIDSAGQELPAGEMGEICVHGVPGRSLTPGYYRDDEATCRLLDAQGWLHSGDRGYLDENGWLFFVDRCGDFIKRSGENISSLEVECVLTSHEKVADAAVVGIADPIRDQAVKAFVQPVENEVLTAQELTDYCTVRLSKFKIPTVIEFVTDFPRTATGKIKKQQLLHHAEGDT